MWFGPQKNLEKKNFTFNLPRTRNWLYREATKPPSYKLHPVLDFLFFSLYFILQIYGILLTVTFFTRVLIGLKRISSFFFCFLKCHYCLNSLVINCWNIFYLFNFFFFCIFVINFHFEFVISHVYCLFMITNGPYHTFVCLLLSSCFFFFFFFVCILYSLFVWLVYLILCLCIFFYYIFFSFALHLVSRLFWYLIKQNIHNLTYSSILIY